MDFSPAASIALSGIVKTNQQGGSFQVSSSLISLCPAVKVCYVFNNRILSSCDGEQPRAMAVAYVPLESP